MAGCEAPTQTHPVTDPASSLPTKCEKSSEILRANNVITRDLERDASQAYGPRRQTRPEQTIPLAFPRPGQHTGTDSCSCEGCMCNAFRSSSSVGTEAYHRHTGPIDHQTNWHPRPTQSWRTFFCDLLHSSQACFVRARLAAFPASARPNFVAWREEMGLGCMTIENEKG